MLLYVLCALCLGIAYFFMTFVDTLTEAHEVSLEMCEYNNEFFDLLKQWITGKKSKKHFKT